MDREIVRNFAKDSKHKYWKISMNHYWSSTIELNCYGYSSYKVQPKGFNSDTMTYYGRSREECIDQEKRLFEALKEKIDYHISWEIEWLEEEKIKTANQIERYKEMYDIPEVKKVIRVHKLKRINNE